MRACQGHWMARLTSVRDFLLPGRTRLTPHRPPTISCCYGRKRSIVTSRRSIPCICNLTPDTANSLCSRAFSGQAATVMTPALISASRLMLIAPHPDDEALACSIVLQQAVHAGAAIRVVYATDGDDNPWPQRVLERKWRLNATDRKRWGKLRRTEELAALRILGVHESDARFLALPDQKLTGLLLRDRRSILERFTAIITEWAPTHLLVPSIADTHPDHSALAVLLRLVLAGFSSNESNLSVWSYCVHGKSPVFFERANKLRQSESEMATKRAAIRCHKTQLKLSGKRFHAYAARPERLLKLDAGDGTIAEGSIHSVERKRDALQLRVRLSAKPMRNSQPAVFVLGQENAGSL